MNTKIVEQFAKLGVNIPEILLPKAGTDISKWAVVACDQYTSEPNYWKQVEQIVGKNPSTLRITLPEIYLEHQNIDKRIENINNTMKDYLKSSVLTSLSKGFVLVDRKTSYVKSRKGLVVALDLEKYDYKKGSKTLIRATEGTIVERLPPRIKIRKNASIELPHIMVLIDDPKKTVIEPLFKSKHQKVYDTNLMMNGGHIKGYHINDEKSLKKVADALTKLANTKTYTKKYNVKDTKVLLFAMGDGNHSLATAKAIWEEKKKKLNPTQFKNSLSRYALVELVNVHDVGLQFEPIHRVLFNVDSMKLLNNFREYCAKNKLTFNNITFNSTKKLNDTLNKLMKNKKQHCIKYINSMGFGIIVVGNPKFNLEVGTLQAFLDEYLKENNHVKIDYIHGDDVVTNLGSKENNVGFYLPIMHKSEFFKTVIVDGALPRKTFSMGHASEKRYYLESRKIK
ncbi:MAG: DUF1015 domain-containing protein [Candidatus Woesearchaeota archaeon]